MTTQELQAMTPEQHKAYMVKYLADKVAKKASKHSNVSKRDKDAASIARDNANGIKTGLEGMSSYEMQRHFQAKNTPSSMR